ncbi:hypothetical protein HDU79_010859, partial [Rhizoclosmatium sp. JEL0117]
MLAINLHLERNPTGHDHLDIEFSESFFQFALKYANVSLPRSNAMLAIDLHLERNPTGIGLRMVPLFNCPGYEWEQVIAIEAKRLRTDFENALARRFIANLGKLAEE